MYFAFLLTTVNYSTEIFINWKTNIQLWLSQVLYPRQILSDLACLEIWTCVPTWSERPTTMIYSHHNVIIIVLLGQQKNVHRESWYRKWCRKEIGLSYCLVVLTWTTNNSHPMILRSNNQWWVAWMKLFPLLSHQCHSHSFVVVDLARWV